MYMCIYNIFTALPPLVRDKEMVIYWMEQDVKGQNYKNFVVKMYCWEETTTNLCKHIKRNVILTIKFPSSKAIWKTFLNFQDKT